jgi:hypothetical protein
MNKGLKTFLYLAIGGTALSVVSFVIWVNVNQDIGGLIFGHVVVAAPSSLTITDRDNRIRLIRLGPDTVITDNGKSVASEAIPVGQFVQISGRRAEHGVIDADVIRLMQSPRRDKPPHETPQ